jgi:capsule polysaccharide modification protein KpsS
VKVLFVGHDIAYVNFYSAIEKALRKRTEFSSLHLYFRPSAWLYARLLLRVPANSPSLKRLLVRLIVAPETNFDSIDLRFYPSTRDAIHRSKFEQLYFNYVRFIENALSNSKFDIAVLPGEYRLFEQATINVIKSLKQSPQIIYFESGPPGYVYFDKSGVNANASFAATGFSQLVANIGSSKVSDTNTRIRRPRLMLKGLIALDTAWLWLAKITSGLLDLEEFWVAMHNRLRMYRVLPSKVMAETDITLTGRYVVFIGQVRSDINHTHFGINDSDLEQRLVELLLSDLSLMLIWRDHPLESSDEIFKRISTVFPSRILRMDKMTLKQVMGYAEGVVTVNSNGGLEALTVGLPVRLLGLSYFAKLKGVCFDNEQFGRFRKKIRNGGPDKDISDDAERFLRDCFVPIDYRNSDFRNAHLAAELIHLCKT